MKKYQWIIFGILFIFTAVLIVLPKYGFIRIDHFLAITLGSIIGTMIIPTIIVYLINIFIEIKNKLNFIFVGSFLMIIMLFVQKTSQGY